jgi:uncharacterized protein
VNTQKITDKSSLQQVQDAIAHLNHLLPAQGPILNFVHENTIEGFQKLPFNEALAAYKHLTGIHGYMKENRFRACYRQGRINDFDLDQVLARVSPEAAGNKIFENDTLVISQVDILKAALRNPLPGITVSQLEWQHNRENALQTWQPDLPSAALDSLQNRTVIAAKFLPSLWLHILDALDIDTTLPDLDQRPVTDIESDSTLTAQAQETMESLLQEVGDSISMDELVKRLSGIDILDSVRPVMLRLSASLLDEGTAAWHLGDGHFTGLYDAWRTSLSQDSGLKLDNLAWEQELANLPDDAEQAVIAQLESLRLPREKWDGYLHRLCLEIQGWTGLINWRQQHPEYHSVNPLAPKLADWLAIRLTLDKLHLKRICPENWGCEGDFSSVADYWRRHPVECWLRHAWQRGDLPEALAHNVAALVQRRSRDNMDWYPLGQELLTLQLTQSNTFSEHAHGWRLFRLCQHLGLGPESLAGLSQNVLRNMLNILTEFDLEQRSQVWLLAYENHYQDDLFQGILTNTRRGHWVDHHATRPQAQIVMCMDEREESFRRHLEELNPRIETLGVAGFFGVPMNYKGLDDVHLTPLCPVVVTPAHNVDEFPRMPEHKTVAAHRKGYASLFRFTYSLHQGFRLNPLLNWVGTLLLAIISLPGQLLHSLLPGVYKNIVDHVRGFFLVPVETDLSITTTTPEAEATTENPRAGFTDKEQAQRVSTLLRTLGLIENFAPLVALSGHGSTSQNNPHEAAHDCGACGGRQGGPNARAFAAMANRPEIRNLLAQENIQIPDDTWFLGLQHDTCSDAITWYDTDGIPDSLQTHFEAFKKDMREAQAWSAHERCRRFSSAGDPATAEAAYRHVVLRSRNLSQVRPEYGHATNASAVIGRRNITQGLFLDRRSFLISYDPTQDPEGNILENILMTAGPVGAGINLEYYFSTIDNDRFGCGTKIPHNVAGMFGVMEGTGSDLRTGLPEQMIEIHEPMRLLVIVEHKTSVLARIYGDQPALQELIGGGWLLLAVKDPDSHSIHMFEPETGFVLWEEKDTVLRECEKSPECYYGKHDPLSPILINQPATQGAT